MMSHKLLIIFLICLILVISNSKNSSNKKTSKSGKGKCALGKPAYKIAQLTNNITSYFQQKQPKSSAFKSKLLKGCACKDKNKRQEKCVRKSIHCTEYVYKYLLCYATKKQKQCDAKANRKQLRDVGILARMETCGKKKKTCKGLDCTIYGLYKYCFKRKDAKKCLTGRITSTDLFKNSKRMSMVTAIAYFICDITKDCSIQTSKPKPNSKKKPRPWLNVKKPSQNPSTGSKGYSRYSNSCPGGVIINGHEHGQLVIFTIKNTLDDPLQIDRVTKSCMNYGQFVDRIFIPKHTDRTINVTDIDTCYKSDFYHGGQFQTRTITFRVRTQSTKSTVQLDYTTWFFFDRITCTMESAEKDYTISDMEVYSAVSSCARGDRKISEVEVKFQKVQTSPITSSSEVKDLSTEGKPTRVTIVNWRMDDITIRFGKADCYWSRDFGYQTYGFSTIRAKDGKTMYAQTCSGDDGRWSSLYFYVYNGNTSIHNNWVVMKIDVRYHDFGSDIDLTTTRTCKITSSHSGYLFDDPLMIVSDVEYCAQSDHAQDAYNINIFDEESFNSKKI